MGVPLRRLFTPPGLGPTVRPTTQRFASTFTSASVSVRNDVEDEGVTGTANRARLTPNPRRYNRSANARLPDPAVKSDADLNRNESNQYNRIATSMARSNATGRAAEAHIRRGQG